MGHALRKALGVIAALQGRGLAAGTAVVAAAGRGAAAGRVQPEGRAGPGLGRPGRPRPALAQVLGLLDQVEAFVAAQAGGQAARLRRWRRPCRSATRTWTCSGPAPTLRRGVARDRRISIEDAEMRHGRKSRSVLFDGYKRHVLRDLDTGLVPAVGITPANVPEASVTGDITADLAAAGRTLAELHIDRAYLSLALVRDRGPDLAIFCKAWRVRNTGGRFPKTVHPRLRRRAADLPRRGRHAVRARRHRPLPGGCLRRLPAAARAAPPAATGAACPSTPMSAAGRAARPPADPGRPREAARTRRGRARPRPRRPLARPPRPLPGTRKNLFDLRRVAVVHNLHVIARQPATGSYEPAA